MQQIDQTTLEGVNSVVMAVVVNSKTKWRSKRFGVNDVETVAEEELSVDLKSLSAGEVIVFLNKHPRMIAVNSVDIHEGVMCATLIISKESH